VDQTFLTGQLLVATPETGGEVFRRSVVLVLHHDEEGAHGVVLNRPIEAAVDAVLPGWEDHVTKPATLFQGGPVGLDSALGLVDLDVPPLVVVPEIAGLRIFAGYSGWSAGQLEREVREGGW
jgi:putative transcriptional regulator